ncbi:uncharacterized protein A4U43_UnF600 [Asparagus officinalis]|uniref:Uncharacterized protein n=1 Tax=Asparagus officinalis TaxID=4686 RepID=A0A1R3L7P5_ASPOF|nr:uncharacterized protein A4U43_UnF600 [Asparagus officinalis]
MEHTWFSNEGLHVDHNRDRKNRIWSKFFDKPEADGSKYSSGPTRRNVEQLLLKLVQSADRRDVKDFVLLQILYQLSMIWSPNSVSGIPRHLFKYVDSIEQVNNTAWGTYIFSETSDAIERALKGPEAGKTTLYLQGCTPLVCGPTAVDTGRARGPRHLLPKKKRGAEDDIPIDADVIPQDIDEDVEQPNEVVEQMEWPQQVIYWKSIAAMNQALRREDENKFKDIIAVDRIKISALSMKPVKFMESSLEKAIAIQAHLMELRENDNEE